MPLTEKSRNLALNGSQLSGETLKADGTWTTPHRVTIDLNDKLGNNDGHFDPGGNGFSRGAQNITLEGTTLHARLKKRDGRSEPNEATFDLAFALSVVDGTFFFSKAKYEHMMSIENGDGELKEFIRDFSANSKNLQIDGSVLSGETKKTDGSWTGDTVDLKFKLGNNDGQFYIDGTDFAATARGIRVEGISLRAELTNSRHRRLEAFVELAAVLKVVDGCFFFRSEYENRSIVSTPAASLADNSRNLRLTDGHLLSGEIRKDGGWVNHSIDLSDKLGNHDGKFNFTEGTNFHRTATEVRVQGATLRAYLKTAAGYDYEDSINLALILKVVDGNFDFVEYERRPSPSDFDGPGLVARSRNLYVRGGLLLGETKKSDGSWTTSTILLSPHMGNDNGKFNLDQRHFTWSASRCRLNGTTLLASLNNGSSWPSEASLDLALVVNVDENGKFTFITEHQRKRIVSSVFCMFVEIDERKVELQGLCLNKYGKLEPSSIDLNSYYKINDSGSFTSDNYDEDSRNFVITAKAVRLEVTSAEVSLEALLPDKSVAKVNLNTNIANRDGSFHFEKNDSLFGRDGAGTQFLEGFPIVGYFVALVHLFNGDNEWAKRAAAVATNSTIVFIGVTIGSAARGPLGAALGAGISTPIGIAAETLIKKSIAADVAIQFEDATVGRYLYETLRNMLAVGASAKFAKWVEKLDFGAAWSALESSELLGKTVKFGARKSGSKAVKQSVKRLLDALTEDKLPQEWLEVEEFVRNS